VRNLSRDLVSGCTVSIERIIMRHGELTLEQMLSDVIVQLVMRRDGVTEAEVRELMASMEHHRAARADDRQFALPVAA